MKMADAEITSTLIKIDALLPRPLHMLNLCIVILEVSLKRRDEANFQMDGRYVLVRQCSGH